jgi:hypothetical protein
MDSKELTRLVDWGITHSFDSLLVVRHGKIVAEAYYARPTLWAFRTRCGLLPSHLSVL